MAAKIYVGDEGTILTFTSDEDISDASVVKIKYRKPNGTTGEWTGSLSGLTGVQYQTQTGEVDTAGKWKLQPYVEAGTWKGHGDIVELQVIPAVDS